MTMKFIITFLFSFFTLTMHAQWTQCNGPFGGTIRDLLIDNTNIFAASYEGGVFFK